MASARNRRVLSDNKQHSLYKWVTSRSANHLNLTGSGSPLLWQDSVGGRFDVTQSFTGELSDLQFWSRVLTANEIYSQATCSSHLVGDVMSWSEELVELHGGLTEFPYEPCHWGMMPGFFQDFSAEMQQTHSSDVDFHQDGVKRWSSWATGGRRTTDLW